MESTFLLLFLLFIFLSSSSTHQQSSNKTTSQPANTSSVRHKDRLQQWQKRLEKIEASQPTSTTDVCHCDLTADHCEVDCCCDQRCDRLEKLAFTRCKSSLSFDSRNDDAASYGNQAFCHSSTHIFDRKRLYLDRQSSRLLCIARTNSRKGEPNYPNRPTITSSGSSLSSLVLAYSKFKWSPAVNRQATSPLVSSIDEDQVKALLDYRSGSTVLVTVRGAAASIGNGSTSEQWLLEQWRLPGVLGDGAQHCNHRALVSYMHDYQAECWRPFITCEDEADFNRIRFHYYDIVAEEYRPVKVEVEGGGNKNVLKVTLDAAKGTCSGLVASVHYIVYHRGINGITRVLLKVRHYLPVNVTLVRQVKQHFAVHFRWDQQWWSGNGTQNATISSNLTATAAESATNGTIYSSSKGYRRGQPLLFAKKQHTGNEISSYSVLPLEKSTLISTYQGGNCGGDEESQIMVAKNHFRFGVNQLTACRLQLKVASISKKAICRRLNSAIAKVTPLFFDGNGIGKNASTLLVSIFGNGTSTFNSTSKEKDWVPVLVLPSTATATTDSQDSSVTQLTALKCNESSPLSMGITTTTNWQVFYARVGLKTSPKLKVVAVTVQSSGQPISSLIEVHCPPSISSKKNDNLTSLCSFALDTELTTVVHFVDVTISPTVPEYAPAPSVRLELPSDFFYPFTASSSTASRLIINIHYSFSLVAVAAFAEAIVAAWLPTF